MRGCFFLMHMQRCAAFFSGNGKIRFQIKRFDAIARLRTSLSTEIVHKARHA
jgi:hypothetical protein